VPIHAPKIQPGGSESKVMGATALITIAGTIIRAHHAASNSAINRRFTA
jgi:hypothetical protein